ncbi:hypothetical protein SAMN05216524_11122 [Mucilaginibacter sp. OK098]|nr:hypothetical protein SAMN05216524_11122 [Mucilaginibacter sp. OK098]
MGESNNDWSAFNARVAVEAAKNQPCYFKTLRWQGRMIIANYDLKTYEVLKTS